MASYGTKKGVVKALVAEDKSTLRKYLRDLVQEDGPLRTERLLDKLFVHTEELQRQPDSRKVADEVLAQEAKANARYLKRNFPSTWYTR